MPDHDAAVAIVRTSGPEESVLLMRRAERVGDPWSGHWSFPGGGCEPEDADAMHTAMRELEEECGVRLGPEQVERALPPMNARRRVGRYLLVAPFVFRVERELPTALDAREAVEAIWVPVRRLCDPAQHALRPVPGLPRSTLFPSIALGVVPLWGFTYRLITEWLRLDPADGAVERYGFQVAANILSFVLSLGLELVRDWHDSGDAKIAVVRGEIPTGPVLEQLESWHGEVPQVNVVEVLPARIRIAGLAFEEYVIEAL